MLNVVTVEVGMSENFCEFLNLVLPVLTISYMEKHTFSDKRIIDIPINPHTSLSLFQDFVCSAAKKIKWSSVRQ